MVSGLSSNEEEQIQQMCILQHLRWYNNYVFADVTQEILIENLKQIHLN
jgi:hypothetical protein